VTILRAARGHQEPIMNTGTVSSHPPPRRFVPPGPRAAAAAVAVAIAIALAATGCEIRDEAAAAAAARALRLKAGPAEAAPAAIEYVEGFAAGLRRSTAENRPLLVVFKARWCRWCAEFAEGTLADRRVVGRSRQFVCVLVDADRHADDCRRFDVREFPTLLVATPGGDEVRRWSGCPAAAEIAAALEGTVPAARMAAADGEAGGEVR